MPAVPREPYPWARVAFSCLLVLAAWAAAMHRAEPTRIPAALRAAQDWAFAKTWLRIGPACAREIAGLARPLWAQAQGRVFELGPGTGDHLPLLPHDGRGRVQGIAAYVVAEPNAHLHPRLAARAARAGFAVRYDPATCPGAAPDAGSAESESEPPPPPPLVIVNATLDGGPAHVPAAIRAHAPYDYVLASQVLCSVRDVQATLQAVHALLAPRGRLVFVEHVAHTDEADATVDAQYAPGSLDLRLWRAVQRAADYVWPAVAGNCHLARDTAAAIAAMPGWASVEYRTRRRTGSLRFSLAPIVYGIATKAP
ncbi:hypothetical protein H4R18_000721 [Coemansia javaensis]|uniref:Methyltransferase domain-containing protein n=1 Tax=Coemansia javaensis TaxID=2761396 RepID=A0A9W8HJ16_9FUNG|nr:hypothetical protein H4R18_000721 [Coemansia javaensis]